MSLEEKGVPYEYIEVNPYEGGSKIPTNQKPPELLAINPSGLVPAINDNGKGLYESLVCVQYLEDAYQNDKPLMPKDPHQRGTVRIWTAFADSKMIPFFYKMLMNQDKEEQTKAKQELLNNLKTWINAMHPTGYFLGNEFSMADIAFLPWAQRFLSVLKHYRGFEVPSTPEYKRYWDWWNTCNERSSFKKTQVNADRLIQNYIGYADNSAQSNAAKTFRDNK